jgi:hypothetical protein
MGLDFEMWVSTELTAVKDLAFALVLRAKGPTTSQPGATPQVNAPSDT